jgi:hypothetical protein
VAVSTVDTLGEGKLVQVQQYQIGEYAKWLAIFISYLTEGYE